MTSGFYPQAKGLAERTNQTVKQVLRALTLGLTDWTLALDVAKIAINNATLTGTVVSTFFLNLGYNPCVWPDVEHAVDPELAVQEDVATFTQCMDASWEAARLALSSEAARGVLVANRHRRMVPAFPVGSRVLVRIIPKRRSVLFPIGLLSPKWAGPYRVLKQVATSTCLLDLPGHHLWNRTYLFNASAL